MSFSTWRSINGWYSRRALLGLPSLPALSLSWMYKPPQTLVVPSGSLFVPLYNWPPFQRLLSLPSLVKGPQGHAAFLWGTVWVLCCQWQNISSHSSLVWRGYTMLNILYGLAIYYCSVCSTLFFPLSSFNIHWKYWRRGVCLSMFWVL